ncbi:MAG TPA: ABC transporter permease [Thermoleophilaceae bacterium]|nr:ABC transporter permease [Thermoleophilaceae bacterium]
MDSGHSAAHHSTVIVPAKGLQFPSIKELWAYRDLVYFLVRRDVSVRYKQSAVGVLWAVLQPLLLAIIFSVFLGRYAKIPSGGGVPYPIFALSGMVMWLFFANAMSLASSSTITSAELISKVFFPRIIIPLAAVLQPVVDFLLALVVVFIAMAIYGVEISPKILLLPLLIPLALAVTLGLGLWLSALHVKYRDVQIAVPFLVQVGLFVTPIIYPFSLVPEAAKPFYALNPMVGILELYRWMLFASADWPGPVVLVPIVAGILALIGGALYFQRAERGFADVI